MPDSDACVCGGPLRNTNVDGNAGHAPGCPANPMWREQERDLDRETIRRWRSEAITAPAQDRIWLNRCEALCVALLDARARLIDEARERMLQADTGDLCDDA
jgi:hypothetical protein